jgi:hypothetical protein
MDALGLLAVVLVLLLPLNISIHLGKWELGRVICLPFLALGLCSTLGAFSRKYSVVRRKFLAN